MVLHLEVRHVAPPQVLGDQDRGHRAGEQAGQADAEPEQDHRDQPADRRLGRRCPGPAKSRTQTFQNDSVQVSNGPWSPGPARPGGCPSRRATQTTIIADDDPDDLVPADRQPERSPAPALGERGPEPMDEGAPGRPISTHEAPRPRRSRSRPCACPGSRPDRPTAGIRPRRSRTDRDPGARSPVAWAWSRSPSRLRGRKARPNDAAERDRAGHAHATGDDAAIRGVKSRRDEPAARSTVDDGEFDTIPAGGPFPRISGGRHR